MKPLTKKQKEYIIDKIKLASLREVEGDGIWSVMLPVEVIAKIIRNDF